MLKKSVLIYLFFFFALIINIKAAIIIPQNTNRILIGKQIQWVVSNQDTPYKINFQNAIQPKDVPNIGLISENVWGKFALTNNSNDEKIFLEIAYPILDEIELWEYDGDQYKKQIFYERNGFNTRKFEYPDYIFELNISKNATKNYFLKVKSAEQIILPVYISHGNQLWAHLSQEAVLNGIYIGLILIMFIYNLFVYFSVRDKSYLYYVIYIVFVGLTQLSIKGYTFQYLWPNAPYFSSISSILFASLSGIGAILVTQSFLHTRINTPKFHVFLQVQVAIFCVAIICSLVNIQVGFLVMQLATTITTLSILYVACYLVIKKYPPALLFFVAWSVLVVGAIVFLLKDYGILPYNKFTSYAMQIASGIEMALLSFGLANRINILKRENELSQAEALSISKENERIILRQNIVLEEQVNKRTLQLSTTLEDLKQAQSQLVQSEKMASLGQLTAGIAHEINNPINFVTSNVNPLKRDVEMLFSAVDHIESVGLSEKSMEDKQSEIEGYKEELDYDYLKVEINHLINGIYDGASRTAEIVKGLRIFSRVDEDDIKIADINEGLTSTLVIMNSTLNNNSITVEKDLRDLPLVECYPGKLNQVFLNIISNAIDAIKMKRGEDYRGELHLKTAVIDNMVSITIKDNGIGMDENTKSKIFDPFYTTKDVGEGTGLGMSIAYNTIKKHEGQILVNSEKEKGTEITVIIPIVQSK